MIEFTSDIQLEATGSGTGQGKRFSSIAYSGGKMRLPQFSHPAVVDLATMRIPAKSRPVLREHDQNRVVGHTERIENSGQALRIDGVISAINEHAREIVESSKNGFPWQQSIGAKFSISSVKFIRAGKKLNANGQTFEGPLYFIQNSELHEISFVALGADDDTSATIMAKRNSQRNEMIMTTQNTQVENGDGTDCPAFITAMNQSTHLPEIDPIREERDRVSKINEMCSRARHPEKQWDRIEHLRASAINGDCSMEFAQNEMLHLLRESYPKVPMHSGSSVNVMNENTIAAAFQIVTGNTDLAVDCFGQEEVDKAMQMRATCPRDVWRMGLQNAGHDPSEFKYDREMIKAAWSSNTISNALDNMANKALEQAYKDTPAQWQKFTRQKTTVDFKENKSIQPSFVGGLEELHKGGEIKHGRLHEENVFTWAVDTFAKMISFPRKDMINDSVNIIMEAMPLMGQAARRKQSDLVWATIMDSSTFFTADHGNYGTGGSALSLSTLEAAVVSMMIQRDEEGNDLDILPKYLAVSPELMITAQQILESIEVSAAEGSPTGNALRNVTELIVEPRLSNTTKFANASTTQWMLFAEALHMPVVFATLDQTQNPIVEMNPAAFNKLGEEMRVYQDIGCALGDYKAAYKATGSA